MDAGCRHRMKGQGVGCGGCSARRRSQRGLGTRGASYSWIAHRRVVHLFVTLVDSHFVIASGFVTSTRHKYAQNQYIV